MSLLMVLAAVTIGLVVGLAVGGLGGGGAVLTVPGLVYLIGQTPHQAATASLVIVGISAVIGLLARHREVRWRAGLGFGAVGAVTAVLGTVLSRHMDQDVLLLAFAGLVLVAAVLMLRKPAAGRDDPEPEDAGPAAAAGVGTLTRVTSPSPAALGQASKIAVAGAVVGFATGLFGVGGGFLIVPVLVLALRWPMPAAAATSLLVIVMNAVSSLGARVAAEQFAWQVIVPVTLAAVVGTLVGKAFADRLPAVTLSRAFGVLLVAVALYTAATSIVALA